MRFVLTADTRKAYPQSNREVAPGEVGELLAHGPYTLRGYYGVPEYNAWPLAKSRKRS